MRTALLSIGSLGATAPELPTPERLLRAEGAARVEIFNRTVEVHRGGRLHADTVEARRIRIDDAPLARLQTRSLLAVGPDAAVRNALLGAAAERYREHWHYAGLTGVHAMDISRERVSGSQGGLLRTERQLAHFQAYTAAVRALADNEREVVDDIVLHEREPVEVGRKLSGYRQEKQATAVALYVLRAGLASLARHFGLLAPTRSRVDRSPGGTPGQRERSG